MHVHNCGREHIAAIDCRHEAAGRSGYLGAAALAHWVLDRRRLAAWDAEWRVTGPRWTSTR